MTSDSPVAVTKHERLTADQVAAITELADLVARLDGYSALSDESRFGLQRTGRHLLARAGHQVTGYAQIWPSGDTELMVRPDSRVQGVGSALWAAALQTGARRVWSHGDLAPARHAARSWHLQPARTLLTMRRSLSTLSSAPVTMPSGYAARTFRPGADEESWLAVNAAAFALHPDQGRWTATDLAARMAEPWFDPNGFFLIQDRSETTSREIAAFHWTKVHPDGTGEVYVLAVDPAHQGHGLAGVVTDLGLRYLADRGCPEVILYVEADNLPARATYSGRGFVIADRDVMYAQA